jgi:hypothetical protein
MGGPPVLGPHQIKSTCKLTVNGRRELHLPSVTVVGAHYAVDDLGIDLGWAYESYTCRTSERYELDRNASQRLFNKADIECLDPTVRRGV